METLKCPVCFSQTVVNDKHESGICPICEQAHFHYMEITQEVCNVKELNGKDISFIDGGWIFEEIPRKENYDIEEDKIH